MSRPTLQHLQVDELITQAGGDPWAIDDSLQSGSPTQINFLAQAFHQAAGSATSAEETFATAQQHFQQYNRENGEQPINNGAEVQRVKDGLHATNEQLGQIAADLETIAAALAVARGTSKANIQSLNDNLQTADYLIGHYLDLESQGLNRDADIEEVRRAAKADTETALHNETYFRNDYSKTLKQSLNNLRTKDGYTPKISTYDAEKEPVAGADGGKGGPAPGTPNSTPGAGPNGTPPAGNAPGADGGAGGNHNGTPPVGDAGNPAVPPGTPVMGPAGGPLVQPAPPPPKEITGKWGNAGDGLAAAGERANIPANVARMPGFVPGGSPSSAIPGGVPTGTALETVEKFGKRLGMAGNVVTVANGIMEGVNDVNNGAAVSTTLVDVGAKTAGDIGGGLVGASTGAEAGAFIGTMIAPGAGTVIGAGVGAVVGGLAGSEIGKKMGEEIADVSHSVWRSLFG
ncbi:putative alpha/beta hydrolase [[Mycobacterium] vasticus]|uniref:Glycine zipper domain-containing protein n=1 Tax=[Mycobacterium] vasticus TaxID=2875777 RepID=A0ABU5Z131_9MYCO|nr:glycine zipper domain-containing protein [Mycolicibacter sp. MYC017]MEB3071111.1 glycine zipper domain-containing protein [Mycolicibacter sp. MYC017]